MNEKNYDNNITISRVREREGEREIETNKNEYTTEKNQKPASLSSMVYRAAVMGVQTKCVRFRIRCSLIVCLRKSHETSERIENNQ